MCLLLLLLRFCVCRFVFFAIVLSILVFVSFVVVVVAFWFLYYCGLACCYFGGFVYCGCCCLCWIGSRA